MKPRISVLTLGVDDLERAVAFYRDGLGLPTEGIVGTQFEHGAVAFFDLHAQVKLALWSREDLAHDAGLPKAAPCPTDFTIGHNVGRKDEVDGVTLGEETRTVLEMLRPPPPASPAPGH